MVLDCGGGGMGGGGHRVVRRPGFPPFPFRRVWDAFHSHVHSDVSCGLRWMLGKMVSSRQIDPTKRRSSSNARLPVEHCPV